MNLFGFLKKKVLAGIFQIFKPYRKRFFTSIAILMLVAIIALIVNSTEPVDNFLGQFVPEKYLFPGIGVIFILLITPLILTLLDMKWIRKFLNKIVKKIPLLSLFWKEEKIPYLLETAIPVAVKFSDAIIAYGFLMGKSSVEDNSGFIKSKELLCVFLPSAPVPFTSVLPIDVSPENVREVEIVGSNGLNQARIAIIRRKSISLGQPLAREIRFKELDISVIEELPILSEKDKKSFKDQMSTD